MESKYRIVGLGFIIFIVLILFYFIIAEYFLQMGEGEMEVFMKLEFAFFISLIGFSFMLTLLKDYLNFIKFFLYFFIINVLALEIMEPFFIGESINISIIFTVSFATIGTILFEDKNIAEEWGLRSLRIITIMGLIFVGTFLATLFIYVYTCIYGSLVREIPFIKLSAFPGDTSEFRFTVFYLSTTIRRISFFIFLISGFYSGQNLSRIRGFKNTTLFILCVLSLILASLELFFDISIKWSFLYVRSLYFGFFFIFQSFSYLINSFRNGLLKSPITWASFIWLIFTLFIIENIAVLTDFPLNFKLQLFILYIIGVFIGLRYFGQSKSEYLF